MNLEKLNDRADRIIDATKKIMKEILISPGLLIFFCGTAIAILGWLWVELFDKEKIKEIKIVRGDSDGN